MQKKKELEEQILRTKGMIKKVLKCKNKIEIEPIRKIMYTRRIKIH